MSSVSDVHDSSTPVIALSNLRFCWNAGQPVLDIPEFTVKQGEKIFIRGPSGSGKTTLLGLIAGVLVPEQGSVQILGTDISRLAAARRDHFRADHIGFIFQMFNLIPYLSLVENVTLPLGFARKRLDHVRTSGCSQEEEALRLLRHLGLNDNELLHRKVTELSIGQQQRVAAARAMIGRPELVIADEPTSALDSDTREAFIRLLFSECEAAGNTLIFVSHDSSLEKLFDRSIDLHEINRASQHQPQGGQT